ncbi:protein kinase [Clostridium beijerinckii]|uniref:Protein kinase n=1 Tax=Clostridium beijerinckii TaxID=1520 RepID=A0A7Y9A0Q2_CLOBE|nr:MULTISPECIES: protein kinase [Clostridium]MBN7572875.1 protein kinase [Clostridium beijerinckii]MBN7578323.1 protein kinase [Clostridium beijerinckii]MBN7582649.1 protein kinase [Clostridium beijerinckii]MBO0521971.1 protein kinase [Clostridium beijerinckii]NMF03842.1 protein kinase [Clostridium beijerinckii]
MKKNFAYSADFDEYTEKLFREAKYLGEGHNGVVYELPNKKAIKIFLRKKVCNDEGSILAKTNGSKYFPYMYKRGKFYVIRDLVDGIRLDKHIKENGLSERLVRNIYELLLEFKRLKFKKLDIRCKDVYVSEDEKLMIIDPKKAYSRKVDYPRHLMKGLCKVGVLDEFFECIKKIDAKKAASWELKFRRYCGAKNLSILDDD